uniref:Uncharacterized protein n=1 Tax=Magnetococcus massalia (strain MO-1) TaxID=451514 RepID=A0A1S7LKA7_MAGMO|nr:Conserved protein of unknown function [Candidatus Magnetococcus massalia]
MYLDYHYHEGASTSEIRSDLIAVLTGESDPANLSASCDKAKTSLITSVPAGWSLHDPAVDSYADVIKAPVSDNPTQFKHVSLYLNSTILYLKVHQDWDATTHTTTNTLTNSESSYGLVISTIYPGRICMSASSNFIAVMSEYTNRDTQANGITRGCSDADSGPLLVTERTRAMLWDTVENGYIPFLWSPIGTVALNRASTLSQSLKYPQANYNYQPHSQDTTDYAVNVFHPIGEGVNSDTSLRQPTGTPGEYSSFVVPLHACDANSSDKTAYLGDITAKCGIYVGPRYSLPDYHELTLNSTPYIAWPVGVADASYGGMVFVPKE